MDAANASDTQWSESGVDFQCMFLISERLNKQHMFCIPDMIDYKKEDLFWRYLGTGKAQRNIHSDIERNLSNFPHYILNVFWMYFNVSLMDRLTIFFLLTESVD